MVLKDLKVVTDLSENLVQSANLVKRVKLVCLVFPVIKDAED
jgi:hypothetical protein